MTTEPSWPLAAWRQSGKTFAYRGRSIFYPVSGAHMAARYRELVPGPDVVMLPDIGHYPQVEDPAGVTRAFLAFQDRLAAVGSGAD